MSLKSKIEAVIYASEEPVTLQQLAALLADEAGAEVDEWMRSQAVLPLLDEEPAPSPSDENLPVDEPLESASTTLAETEQDRREARERERAIRDHVRRAVDTLIREYADSDRGIEIREVASGFRMGTKPEYHDAVRGFVKSLKPALKLTLQALETLAVVAYKQPVTAAEISDIRGVDSAGVLGGLLARKLIATAGRKQVIGRPMLYKTTRDFLLRFGLKDVNELPSMEEFERMAGELAEQEGLPVESADALIEQANARGDAELIRGANAPEQPPSTPEAEAGADEQSSNAATAESAAGGNNEQHTHIDQHRATEAEALYTAESSDRSTGEATRQTDQG